MTDGLTINGGNNFTGTAASPLDPLLGPLANNGGFTQTHALLAGSPAIDAGSDTLAAGLPTDQRGLLFVRSFDDPTASGASVDIGAFESQTLSQVLVVDNRVDENDGDASAGNLSLREAIGLTNSNFGANTITFDPTVFGTAQTISLMTEGLAISDSVTIVGPGQNLLAVDGSSNGTPGTGDGIRIFDIDDGNDATTIEVEISGLTISGGNLAASGAGIQATEQITLDSVTVTDNHVIGSNSRGGGIHFVGLPGASLTIVDSTISNNSTENFGGGLSTSLGDNDNASVTVLRTTITGNTATSAGGGVFNRNGIGSNFEIVDSTIDGNTSIGNGGGLYSRHNVEGTLTATIIGTTISNNVVTGDEQRGGGIHIERGGLLLTDSTVSGNRVTGADSEGGGLFSRYGAQINGSIIENNYTVTDGSEGGGILTIFGALEITNSVVRGNYTQGASSEGGGIFVDSGTATILHSTISDNETRGGNSQGGGIFGSTGSVVSLESSTVSDNRTTGSFSGGAGISSFADVSLLNSTISGNRAEGSTSRGGGITADGAVTVRFSTITNNYVSDFLAPGGGGIRKLSATGDVTISHSIIAGNSTDSGVGPDLRLGSNATVVVDDSLIGSNGASELSAAPTPDSNGNLIGDSDVVGGEINPLLGPLADNGGPTQTHELLSGSPAIDMGDPSLATPPDFDQRGAPFVRVSSGRIDIGAFELQPMLAPTVTSVVRDGGGVLARPDLLNTFVVTFDQDVNVSAGDLIVRNDTLSGVVVDTSGIGFGYALGTLTATWDFSSLPDLDAAFYTFEVSDTITGVLGGLALDGDANGTAGGVYSESIYVAIPGDANLDGDVDVTQIVFGPGGVQNVGDASILLANLGTVVGATYNQGDFNGDGDVDVTQIMFGPDGVQNVGDASILLANLGTNVVPPPAAVAASSHARREASKLTEPLAMESVTDLASIPVLSANTVSATPLGAWESTWHQSVRERLALADTPLKLSGATPDTHKAVDDFFAASEVHVEISDWQDILLETDV